MFCITFLEPPYFINTPLKSVLTPYGKSITLKCSFGGVPLPNITWFKDGMVISTNQYTSSSQSDTVTTILTVPVFFNSQRNYTCQAVNDLVERRAISTTVNVKSNTLEFISCTIALCNVSKHIIISIFLFPIVVNTPPVIEASDTFMITVGETALYTLRITDPGDTISVTIDGEFPYTLYQNESIWTLNVTLSSLVEFNFTVVATDSFNATSAKTPRVCIAYDTASAAVHNSLLYNELKTESPLIFRSCLPPFCKFNKHYSYIFLPKTFV